MESEIERMRPIKSEVNRLYGSNQKILSMTNWEPEFAGLDGFKKGLKATIEWFIDPNNLGLYKSEYTV